MIPFFPQCCFRHIYFRLTAFKTRLRR